MKIIVGLGNPGRRYTGTRHNLGFMVIEGVAQRVRAPFVQEKYRGKIAETEYAGEKILLLKPLTYMNNSGISVARALRYRGVNAAALLVIADDIHLPVGKLRLRPAGTAGGHNGLASVIQHLGTPEFPRLRIGVGQDQPGPGQLTDYVLGRFTPEERHTINLAAPRAVEAVLSFIAEGITKTMNAFN